MFYTGDPLTDFHRHDAEMEDALALLPKCADCGEPIQEEQCFVVNDETICESCMEGYKVYTAHLMG